MKWKCASNFELNSPSLTFIEIQRDRRLELQSIFHFIGFDPFSFFCGYKCISFFPDKKTTSETSQWFKEDPQIYRIQILTICYSCKNTYQWEQKNSMSSLLLLLFITMEQLQWAWALVIQTCDFLFYLIYLFNRRCSAVGMLSQNEKNKI